MSFWYIKERVTTAIINDQDPTLDNDGDEFICKRRWFIKQTGLYAPPTYQYIRWDGPSILNHDGFNGWLIDGTSTKYENPYGKNGHLCADTGHGFNYGWAASIYGIGIHEETDHTTDTRQCDTWLTGTRKDLINDSRKDSLHWAWGASKPARSDPTVFYNY